MERRPNPDELLARVQEAEHQQTRGKLKIFFGAAAGVGKTYAMLQAAHECRAAGRDVVVGWVETHGRAETQALLDGLEILPARELPYRGTTLREFDLDAALARRPGLLLLDELAHSNAEGSRHAKRWQDAEELLRAGIDIYTTINVQHLESLNDVVAQITGVIVRETVPDSIIERADEIELIDLPPDELLQRLNEGKVYVPDQAQQAIRNFFRKGNLIALREMALRRTADRVDAQMRIYKRDKAITQVWPTCERLLVCVSPSPASARLVRGAKRMADGLQAEWLAVYVETPRHARLSETDHNRVMQTLRLAKQLGAEVVTLSGHDASEEVLAFARTRNVSKIIVGKPTRTHLRDVIRGAFVDKLVRHSGEIDVYFISGAQEDTRSPSTRLPKRSRDWHGYLWAGLAVALCTLVGRLIFPFASDADVIMVYLLGITIIATRYGRGPSLLASALSVVVFNFFFTMPYFTLLVANQKYIVTFGVMFIVALVISTLTARIRAQAEASRQRERRTAALYALSREFASKRGRNLLLNAAAQHISEVFDSQIAILLPDEEGRVAPWRGEHAQLQPSVSEQGVAQWVYDHSQMAGLGTDTLPSAGALYLPLRGSRGTVGVLGIRPTEHTYLQSPEQLYLLETFANQTALAIERMALAAEAQQAQVKVEMEQMRSSLLSSVSHDLRTPLASITGAASSLLENDKTFDRTTRCDLIQTIYEEADRLNRLVSNLLDMTRIESGTIQVHKEWQPLEEVIGTALYRLDSQLTDRPVTTHLSPDLPLVPLDSMLIEQVLVNLLDNALKYTPPGSPLELSAWMQAATSPDSAAEVVVAVADRGRGFAPGEELRIFDKFYRAKANGNSRNGGVGLGLAICRGIIAAHRGRIWAENRPGGGAVVRFALPLEGSPPVVEDES